MRVYRDQYDRHSGRRKQPQDNYRRDNNRREMYDAICDDCGKDCQVPFKPSGDKPIYCSRCFEKHDDGGRSKRGGNDRGGRRDNYRRDERKEMFKTICDECGKECEVPFKPSSDKPIYCSDCFEKKGGNSSRGGNNVQLEEKIQELEKKINRILEILEPETPSEDTPEPVEEVSDIETEEQLITEE